MKDIKDYFLSPQKQVAKDANHLESQNLIDNQQEFDNKEKSKRKRKKKKKRKDSDPAVRDVTQLLSDNLKFSPNYSLSKTKVSITESSKIDIKSPKGMKENKPENSDYSTRENTFNTTNAIPEVNSDRETKSPTSKEKGIDTEDGIIKASVLNAFQFMMDRRYKSIGTNSPGKELVKESLDIQENNKEKLAARRDLFLNWSEHKGSLKRKRLEEEKDEIIKKKLTVRKKRLKNLLKVNGDEDVKKERVTRKKRIKKIATSSEESDNDFENKQIIKESTKSNQEDVPNQQNHLKSIRNKAVNKIASRDDDPDDEFEIQVQKKQKTTKPNEEANVEERTENDDEKSHNNSKRSANKKIKDNSEIAASSLTTSNSENGQKRRSSRKPIKNSKFVEILSDLEDTENEKSKKNKNSKTSRKQKIKDTLSEKPKKSKTLNNKVTEETIPKTRESSKGVSNVKPKNGNILTFLKAEINEKDESSDCEIIENVDIEQEKDDIDTDPEMSLIIRSKRSRLSPKSDNSNVSKKTTKKKTDIFMDESSQENLLTPRTLRSWKMKIKINIDNDEVNLENSISRERKLVNYNEDSSEGFSEESDAISLSSESSENDVSFEKITRKPLKIAPIFTKSTPKPKEDPAIVEARKQFLMSGIPSSLKKTIERQNSITDQQYNVFPVTQHIQQKCDSLFWSLPQPKLRLMENAPLLVKSDLKCETLTKSHLIKSINIDTEVKKVDKLKELLNKIKAENPNYPVNKSFRQINAKFRQKTNETTETIKSPEKRKKSRKKKGKDIKVNIETDVEQKIDSDPVEYAMWTEKYKPKSSNDIIGNNKAVKNLKKWLEDWKQFSQEINSRKRKKRSTSSSSEFETTDCDSRDSSKLPGKIVVLGGPYGSGKTTTVYAICNELGFNIIELNASSKRTGKRLLQELQEATQSHQVRNGESQSFQNYFQSCQSEKLENSELSDKKMCVLLVEDVDIVFEQDDGFISALMQLATSSKRPIIATTTDYYSTFVQKFLGHYEYIHFSPLSAYSLATWLQIVFLVEGLYVSQDEIGSLLEYYKGDVRKTLLQLQFWVQSGGQLQNAESCIKIKHKRNSCDEQLIEDEEGESCHNNNSTELNIFEHKNCFECFEILEIEECFKIPYSIDLGLLWWNMSNILNMPNFSKQRINNLEDINTNELKSNSSRAENKKNVLSISQLYDSISHVDILFKYNCFDTVESLSSNHIDIKDSLELGETFDSYRNVELVNDLAHSLINGYIRNFKAADEDCLLDITMPDKSERRWKTRLEECEKSFEDCLLLSTERKSTALDYMPVLRSIARAESSRAATNTKRGNRFRSYLRDLGIKSNENLIKIANRILIYNDM